MPYWRTVRDKNSVLGLMTSYLLTSDDGITCCCSGLRYTPLCSGDLKMLELQMKRGDNTRLAFWFKY